RPAAVAREPADEDALSRRPSRTHPCTHNVAVRAGSALPDRHRNDPAVAAELVAVAHDVAESRPPHHSLRAFARYSTSVVVRASSRVVVRRNRRAVVTAPSQLRSRRSPLVVAPSKPWPLAASPLLPALPRVCPCSHAAVRTRRRPLGAVTPHFHRSPARRLPHHCEPAARIAAIAAHASG
ncbi:hypothetical protein Dimus_000530, partial [Dionaea muscipula]